jgi:hypothetical protein
MNKTSKALTAIVLVAAAAFAVSACKWPGAKDPVAPASSAAVAEATPTAPDASATPPASDAAASGAVAKDTPVKSGK